MSEDAGKCPVPALALTAGRPARSAVEWREDAAAVQNNRMRTIALEEHFWTPELAAAPGTGVLARADGPRLDEALRDLDKARLLDMDAAGIDVQVISPRSRPRKGCPASRGRARRGGRTTTWPRRLPGTRSGGGVRHAADGIPGGGGRRAVARGRGPRVRGRDGQQHARTDGAFLDDPRFAPLLARFEPLDVPLTCIRRRRRLLSGSRCTAGCLGRWRGHSPPTPGGGTPRRGCTRSG